MKILMISTVYSTTPARGYGGIQRVVYYLTEALVRLGHEVILLAPPGSYCSGRTIEVAAYDPSRPWKKIRCEDDMMSEEPLYDAAVRFLDDEPVDIVHDWSFQNLIPARQSTPFIVSTCIPPAPGFARPNLVACSRAHAELIGGATRYVHYGLPLEDWPWERNKSKSPVHIAKMARYKGQHLAALAAIMTKTRLTFAGNVEESLYFNLCMRPLLALPGLSYIGEISETTDVLLPSEALVQTPLWFDAFPLIVLESNACGTPVIALSAGGVPEQIDNGRTGFLCNGFRELRAAFKNIGDIDPVHCREHAERKFSDERMARDYLALYEDIINGARW